MNYKYVVVWENGMDIVVAEFGQTYVSERPGFSTNKLHVGRRQACPYSDAIDLDAAVPKLIPRIPSLMT